MFPCSKNIKHQLRWNMILSCVIDEVLDVGGVWLFTCEAPVYVCDGFLSNLNSTLDKRPHPVDN